MVLSVPHVGRTNRLRSLILDIFNGNLCHWIQLCLLACYSTSNTALSAGVSANCACSCFSPNFAQYNCYLNFTQYSVTLYRVIKKFLSTWWLQYRKLQVKFKVSPTSLQTFIDTSNCVLEDPVQYSKVHIPNVFCDGHLQIISCVWICTVIIRLTETFWSPCIMIYGRDVRWNTLEVLL